MKAEKEINFDFFPNSEPFGGRNPRAAPILLKKVP